MISFDPVLVPGALAMSQTTDPEPQIRSGSAPHATERASKHLHALLSAGYHTPELIGAGGMGVVYRARHPWLDRWVAIKLMRDLDGAGPQVRREAQALGRLSHPNIVAVHEAGHLPGGRGYLVMEFVGGGTLRAWQQQAHPWTEILEAYIHAGRGLEAAHAAGIVHGDFKPDNVLIGDDGAVKVADFGLAVAPDTWAPAHVPAGVPGTWCYMSPEQLSGSPPGPASDQFSFAVSLHEALGGHPFRDDLSNTHSSAPPRADAWLRRLQRGPRAFPAERSVPTRLVVALHRALSLRPEDRFPSMTDFLRTLSTLAPGGRGRLLVPAVSVTVGALAFTFATVLNLKSDALLERTTETGVDESTPLAPRAELDPFAADREMIDAAARLTVKAPDEAAALLWAADSSAAPDRWSQAAFELDPSACPIVVREDVGPGAAEVVISKDDRWLLAVSESMEIVLYERSTRTARWRARVPVGYLTMSPDSRRALIALQDRRLLSVPLGEEYAPTMIGRTGGDVREITFSDDGSHYATSDSAGVIEIRTSSDDKLIGELRTSGGRIYSLVLSRDGSSVAVASEGGGATLWDTRSQRLIRRFGAQFGITYGVRFSPDGQALLVGSGDGNARLWPLEGGVPRKLSGHHDAVRYVKFSPRGKWILTWSLDGTARVWDAATARTRRLLTIGKPNTAPPVFTPDDSSILVATEDGIVQFWSLKDPAAERRPIREYRGHAGPITSLYHSHSGDWFISSGNDHRLVVWRSSDPPPGEVLWRSTSFVKMAVIDPSGERLAVAGDGFTVHIISLTSSSRPLILKGHQQVIWTGNFDASGERFLTASSDGTAIVWSTRTGEVLKRLAGPGGRVIGASFAPSGNQAALGGADNPTVIVWNLQDDSMQHLYGHEAEVKTPRFSPDGLSLLTASDDHTVRMWDLSSAASRTTLQHDDLVSKASFSPSGEFILSASYDNTARIWSSEPPFAELARVRHESSVRDAEFDSSGEMFLTTSDDGTVGIWTWDGKQVREYRGHAAPTLKAAFSPRWPWIASASRDGDLRLWRVDEESVGLRQEGHSGFPWMLSFSPGGERLYSAFDDGTVRQWDIGQVDARDRVKRCLVSCPSAASLAAHGIDRSRAEEVVRRCESASSGRQ